MPDLTKNPFYGLGKKEPKEKKERIKRDQTWRVRYAAAHKKWYETEYPIAFREGHYSPPDYPIVHTANGFANAIGNYMKWNGGIGNRINNMGIAGKDGKRRKSTTINGTADTDLTFPNGKNAKGELKIGRDTPSDAQLKMQARVRKTGGVYEFLKTMQDFYYLYDKMMHGELF